MASSLPNDLAVSSKLGFSVDSQGKVKEAAVSSSYPLHTSQPEIQIQDVWDKVCPTAFFFFFLMYCAILILPILILPIVMKHPEMAP